ncbi:MAG: hypothetical protein ABIV63_05135 [Caldimonas sp.]
MRHSHASHAIANGMPIEIAQQNIGHASLATTPDEGRRGVLEAVGPPAPIA